jgi:hypothetical protein
VKPTIRILLLAGTVLVAFAAPPSSRPAIAAADLDANAGLGRQH